MECDQIIGLALQIFGRAVCAGVVTLTDDQRASIRREIDRYASYEAEVGPSAVRVLQAFELQSKELESLREELNQMKQKEHLVLDIRARINKMNA